MRSTPHGPSTAPRASPRRENPGDDLKSTLADTVEKDVALSKAVALIKKSKNPARSGAPPHFFRRDRQQITPFFQEALLLGMGAGRTRTNSIHPETPPQTGTHSHEGSTSSPEAKFWPESTIPRASPPGRPLHLKTPTEEIVSLLGNQPQSLLHATGIMFDWSMVEREAS